jgi:hypothetical protein
MTSAMPYAVAAMAVALVLLTPFAWWMGFQIYRDGAVERRELAAERQQHQARHDLVAALGATSQRGVDAPTGALEPAQIARLLEKR